MNREVDGHSNPCMQIPPTTTGIAIIGGLEGPKMQPDAYTEVNN